MNEQATHNFSDILRAVAFWLIVKPFVGVVLGVNVKGRERLPRGGPAIVVANHNSHLATARPDVPVHPVHLRNTGRALPRGEALFVPMVCDLTIGDPLIGLTDRDAFMTALTQYSQQGPVE